MTIPYDFMCMIPIEGVHGSLSVYTPYPVYLSCLACNTNSLSIFICDQYGNPVTIIDADNTFSLVIQEEVVGQK